MLTKIFRLSMLWFLLGVVYYVIEILWRVPQGNWPHPSMIIVGGICGICVGTINQFEKFFSLSVFKQSVIGTLMTLAVEFISGLILNILLGLNIWDYSHMWGNICGQICIQFAFAWLLIMPFAIWLEDWLRWGFGWNGKKYSLGSIYWDFVRLK